MLKDDRHFDEFICVCGGDDAEDRAHQAAILLNEVKNGLSGGSASLGPRPCTDANLLTMVVESLEWDFGAHISGIANDMWSGVSAETFQKGDDGRPLFSTYIQCDHVEHGIAATWRAFANRFPEKLQEAH